MYAKLNNGQVEKYPYTIGQLRKDHRNVSFPKAMTAWSIKEPPYYAATDAFMWGDFPKTLADNMFAKLIKGA